MATSTAAFTGFRQQGIQFLADLAANNDRAWFQPRRAEYERLLKEPLAAFCSALEKEFRSRGLPLSADPAKSPFRIYRDVRFSKDKSPYKTNLGAGFPWDEADGSAVKSDAGVGGYFHFQPGGMYVGGGTWQPSTATLRSWRKTVVEHGKTVHKAIESPKFAAEFGSLHGEHFKRVPPDAPADHPDAELLTLKQLLFGRDLADSDVLSARLPNIVADAFVAALPVMRLLASLG